MTEFPDRWKKGKFLRDEFRQYLKVLPEEDVKEIIWLKENEHVPKMIQVLVIGNSLSNMLEKNKEKTITVKRLIQRYRRNRNERIRKQIMNILTFGKKKQEFHAEQKNTLHQIESTADTKPSYEELKKIIDGLLSTYGKDWEHLHKHNIDEAGKTTND